jgi:hypothetical protein
MKTHGKRDTVTLKLVHDSIGHTDILKHALQL